LLSIFEIKAGTTTDDERADQLAQALIKLVSKDDRREAEKRFCISEDRSRFLSKDTLKFIATAESVAEHLESDASLEWSPAIIGLCKGVEMEIINRVMNPLSVLVAGENLEEDKKDKDIGRVATFCTAPDRKPPELGAISHFLQTVIHSKQRRETSKLITCFLILAAEWSGSTWFLAKDGLYQSLTQLTTRFRNPAAHTDELTKEHYSQCRELTIGSNGMMWKLVLSTKHHKK